MKPIICIVFLFSFGTIAFGQKKMNGVDWTKKIEGDYYKNKNNYLIIYSDSSSNKKGFNYELNLKKKGIHEIGRLMSSDTDETDFGIPNWVYLSPENDTFESIIGSCHLEFDNVGNKESMTIWKKTKPFTKNRILIKLSTTKPKPN